MVREARIALGGVATVPWRAREAEQVLNGQVLDVALAEKAAAVAFEGARVRAHNAFKVGTGKQTLVRALMETRAMEIQPSNAVPANAAAPRPEENQGPPRTPHRGAAEGHR